MHVIIFANAPMNSPPDSLPSADLLIAADGGARRAFSLGRVPDVIIGDLDSLSADEFAGFDRAGAGVLRYPAEKDETDLELALSYALEKDARAITLIAALGGRWDMSFSNVLLLAQPRFASVRINLIEGRTQFHLVRPNQPLHLSGQPGALVSAIPLGGPVLGVSYQGLLWPLDRVDLPFGSPRGVSNRMAATEARVEVEAGVLLVIYDEEDVEGVHR